MPIFNLADYCRPDHLNGDGSIRYDKPIAYALNALFEGVRHTQIPGTGFGWGGSKIEIPANILYLGEPVNAADTESWDWRPTMGPLSIYSGDLWQDAGEYVESDYPGIKDKWIPARFRNGTVAKLSNGSPDPTAGAVPAENSPMLDLSASSGFTMEGTVWNAQKHSVLGPGPGQIEPPRSPGGALLLANLERARRNPTTGQVYWDGSGTPRTSNNTKLDRVGGTGWFHTAIIHYLNSVIHDWFGGLQVARNGPGVRALAATDRALAGAAGGWYESPFFPRLANPQEGDYRIQDTPVGVGALNLLGEIHSMVRETNPLPAPLPGLSYRSTLAAPILFQGLNQASFTGVKPVGSDGLAIFEFKNFVRLVSFRDTEFWNPDSHQYPDGSSNPTCVVFLNGCRYQVASDTDHREPAQNITFDGCVLNSPFGSDGAIIRGVSNSALRGLSFGPNNNTRPDVPIVDLSIGYNAGTATSCLDDSEIWCKGSPIKVGGSLNNSVLLRRPGAVSVQGVDNSLR